MRFRPIRSNMHLNREAALELYSLSHLLFDQPLRLG
jgi:hypothetical protein